MSRHSSHGKEQVIDLTSSPVLKRTRQSSGDFDNKRFQTFLDSQSFTNNFKSASTVVEKVVRFDTLGSPFMPKIFADKDWASLFGNFEDPIDKLVKEFYSNAWFTEVELKCWVRGKDFVITPNYLEKILHINHLENVDTPLYDERLALVIEILDILGADHEVSFICTSIKTAKFGPEMKILTLIMFFNLYPLPNTGFINLGRAQFLCDLIKEAQIDIFAHIFQTMGKTVGRSAARMCLPFCSLAMKIMIFKGVYLLKEGTTLSC